MTDQQEMTVATINAASYTPPPAIGPTDDTVSLCIRTATICELHTAAVAIHKEVLRRSTIPLTFVENLDDQEN